MEEIIKFGHSICVQQVGRWSGRRGGSEKTFIDLVTSTLTQETQVNKQRKRIPGKRNSQEMEEPEQM